MRTANGTTCPATTICPTSARKEQVRMRRGEDKAATSTCEDVKTDREVRMRGVAVCERGTQKNKREAARSDRY